MKSTQSRQQRIVKMAREHGGVRVRDLADLFGVSEVTVRADLDSLERQGLLMRTHGGAITQTGTPLDIAFFQRVQQHHAEKERIGVAAARLIREGDVVLFDGGSTPLQVAENTIGLSHTVFITVGLNVAEVLASHNPQATILMASGELNRRTLAVEGDRVAASLDRLNINRLILAIHAFDVQNGLTDLTLSQASTKRLLMEASDEVVLVADSSKCGDVAFVTVAPLSSVHTIVTDTGLSDETAGEIEALGVRVFRA